MSDANDASVARAMQEAIDIYRKAGATIVEVDLPHTSYGIPTYYIVATAEASSNLARYDGVRYGHRTKVEGDIVDLYSRSRDEGFGPEVKRRIMLGTYALSSGYYDAYYLRALKVRRLIKHDFDVAFAKSDGTNSGANSGGNSGGGGCDAILCPTTTGPAFRFGEKTDNPLEMYLNDVYTVNANLAGIPGISIPAGFAPENGAGRRLPLGIQLLGRTFDEARLLRLARVYEKATNYGLQRPTL